MPPLITLEGTRCEKRWSVGPDDFVLPSLLAIVVALFNSSLTLAAIIALCLPTSEQYSSSNSSNCSHCEPILWAPLSALGGLELANLVSEGLLFAFSILGPIVKETRSSKLRNRTIPHIITVHSIISSGKLLAIIASVISFCLYMHKKKSCCDIQTSNIKFFMAVLMIQAIMFVFYICKVCVFTDPFGITTPRLLAKLEVPRANHGDVHMATTLAVAKRGNSYDDPTQIYNESLLIEKNKDILRSIFCCLGVRGQVAEPVAIEDGARLLYSIMGDTQFVLSDLLAGFTLLRKYQQEQKMKYGEKALYERFRMIMFEKMTAAQRCELPHDELRGNNNFDPRETSNQLLLQDLVYYMKYAMGVFGWPLYVDTHKLCGTCQLLCPVKCHRGYTEDEKFIKDNCCMCNIGAFTKTTNIQERDILLASFDNSVFQAPYIVSMDHKMKALVICIRGSMSFKDVLTCMSLSPVLLDMRGGKKGYIHGGMYKAADKIKKTLLEKNFLEEPFKNYPDYSIVVTGHSLGAGVASILAILIKQELQCSNKLLKCFAYSPPGGILSFKLAEDTKSFITSVVLGNDMVPRLSLHGLLHLKESIRSMLNKTDLPKCQVLLCSRTEKCKNCCCCFCPKRKEPVMDQSRENTVLEEQAKEQSGYDAYKIFQEKLTLDEIKDEVFTDTAITDRPPVRTRKLSIFYPTPPPNIKALQEAVTLRKENILDSTKPHPLKRKLSHKFTDNRIVTQVSESMENHCYVNEGKDFLPCFLPGKVLHIQEKQERWFTRGPYDITIVPRENMSVILVDRGMRSHHFITTVLRALQDYTSSIAIDNRKINNLRQEEARDRKHERENPKAENTTVNDSASNPGRGNTRPVLPAIPEGASSTSLFSSSSLPLSAGHKISTISLHGDCWVPENKCNTIYI